MATMVLARTVDVATGKLLTEREYNFREPEARDLLLRHIIHCVNNGKGVAVSNVKDENNAER